MLQRFVALLVTAPFLFHAHIHCTRRHPLLEERWAAHHTLHLGLGTLIEAVIGLILASNLLHLFISGGTAVKIVKGFGTENPEIAPLAGNGKRVGGDERAGTLVLDDNDANEPEECAAASRGKGHVWGRRNSFFLP
ncbi:hypothetical protein OG21DRAFT_1603721 [Imleria badia]|nr:hypothetical protein OG21DRAFT_1603721 [Imleria badia]